MKLFAINENHLYSKTYAKGRRCLCKNISVYILKDLRAERLRRSNPAGIYINRIGIAAGKKIGGAVVRNRAKRIIREAYRAAEKNYNIKTGFLIVLSAGKSCAVCKTADVERDLIYALRKLGMLNI